MTHYATAVSPADVADPNELLAVVARWPSRWRDHFAERDAILAIDARFPHVPAIREAFKDTIVCAQREDVPLLLQRSRP